MSRKVPGGGCFYTFDSQGSTAQHLDSSGNVLCSYLHDGFGNWVASASGCDDVFGWGGQWGYYTDSQTGLRLCGHRFYDNGTARWLTRDPISYNGGVNLYGYCQNDPINDSDPEGTWAVAPPPEAPTIPTGGGIWPVLGRVGMGLLAGPGGVALMGGGLLLGCPTAAGSADEDDCVEAMNSLENNIDYFKGRTTRGGQPVGGRPRLSYYPKARGGKSLDAAHMAELEKRCKSMAAAIAKIEECLGRGGISDAGAAGKLLGEATRLFNNICPQAGFNPIMPPRIR